MPGIDRTVLFGQLLTPAGVPAAGVGVAVVVAGETLAATVTARNGLFILTVAGRQGGGSTRDAHILLSVNRTPIAASLPTAAGIYGPLRIVAERSPDPEHASLAPRPILGVDEKTLADILVAAPELFVAPLTAEASDPCSAYGAPNVANRTYYLTQLLPLVPAQAAKQEQALEQASARSDLRQVSSAPQAVARTQYGVLVTYRQDWWDLGHSVGDLLYSLPLAPGEETNIATVDWRRVDQAQRQSSLDESVSQDTSIAHVDSVDDAVTMASQQSSNSTSTSTTSGAGGSFGFSLLGFSIGGSGSDSTTKTVTDLQAAATSATRNCQEINDNVRQVSNTLRGTRSMAVAEVSESESSTVSTRVVRNHNHAHTLTIEYSQVIAHYLVETSPDALVPVQFIEMPRLGFEERLSAEQLVDLYGQVILRSLREPAYAGELRAFIDAARTSTQAATPQPPTPSTKSNGQIYLAAYISSDENLAHVRSTGDASVAIDGNSIRLSVEPVAMGDDPHWVFATGSGSPVDYAATGHAIEFDFPFLQAPPGVPVPLSLEHITLICQDDNGVTAHSLLRDAVAVQIGSPVSHDIHPGDIQVATWPLAPVTQPPAPPPPMPTLSDALATHLADNYLYYWGAVQASLDSSAIYAWLAALMLEDIVAPQIVGQLGKMAAFPLLNPNDLPAAFLTKDVAEVKLEGSDRRVVTLPTPAIYAESVLGACSAAEVIDNSRFWDWMRSPIPEDAPQITADMLASRYQSMAGMTAVEQSSLVPPPITVPAQPQPFITVGDQTLSKLIDQLDLSDPGKAVDFLRGVAGAEASASGFSPGETDSTSAVGGASSTTGVGDAAGLLSATSSLGDIAGLLLA